MFFDGVWWSIRRGCLLVLTGFITACASTAPMAPVEVRRIGHPGGPPPDPGVVPVAAAATTARPGYHIVKRGETLYSIANVYGKSYRDVAVWNNLSNAAVIEVGQELRIAPPDGQVVEAVPAQTVEVLPAGGSVVASVPAATTQPGPSDMVAKTLPRGGRLPYSPQAWADVQAQTSGAAIAAGASKAAESAPVAAGGSDELDWIWPTTGKVIAGFNDTGSKGLDIVGAAGQPVVAAGAGTVLYVGSSLRGYGNLVIIRHNGTFLSAYANNKEILVKEGQSVEKGQKVALMGNSDTDRVKLHFEIRRQGKPVDPARYLPTQ